MTHYTRVPLRNGRPKRRPPTLPRWLLAGLLGGAVAWLVLEFPRTPRRAEGPAFPRMAEGLADAGPDGEAKRAHP